MTASTTHPGSGFVDVTKLAVVEDLVEAEAGIDSESDVGPT
jgi:hypothetical protein